MLTRADIMMVKQSSYYLIDNFCRTYDEHDQLNQLKRFPKWEHFRILSDICDQGLIDYHEKGKECQIICVPKSRQMMVSWWACGFALDKIMCFDNQLVVWQSKKEDDAKKQVRRIRYMYEHLLEAPAFHRHFPLIRPMNKQKETILEFKNGSRVEAVPEGGDVIHSLVPTIVIADEAQMQDDFEDSYKATIPCAQLYIIIGTAEPGYFQRLVQDTDGDIYDLEAA